MDTTKIATVAQHITKETSDLCSIYWIYISFALMALVLVLIFMLLVKTAKKSQKTLDKEKIKGDGIVDFGNTINSAFHSKPLYDSLIRQCHPDRFVDDEQLRAKATELSQKITESQSNYAKLLELKAQAIKELNIHI